MKTIAWKKIFPELLATSGGMLLMNQDGLINGWSSPNIARLTQPNATIPLTPMEASWLATSLTLGTLASVILVPICIELAGTRKSALYAFVPISVSWVMMMTANSAIYLYIARFVSGTATTLAYSSPLLYLGEITMPELRGTFVSITSIGWGFGAIMVSFSESYLSRVVSCSIYLVPCLLGMLLFAWLPDSPYQLIKNKHPLKAQQSLDWYRGYSQTETEMKEIIDYVESTERITLAEKMKQLKSTVIQKAVLLVSLVHLLPQLCGINNVFIYMEVILTKGKSHLVDPSDMVIYVNIISLVATISTVNLTDKFGRRTLILASNTVMALALSGLGLHYYLLKNVTIDPVKIQILPVASIVILSVVFSIGYMPVVNTLTGEIFPSSIKSTAVTIATFIGALTGFASTLVYQFFIDTIGETYVFFMYAVFMAFSIPIFLFFLPETKGKSLQEIQNDLNNKN